MDWDHAVVLLEQMRRAHTTRWWWPWHCRCGDRHPCEARRHAESELPKYERTVA